MALTFYSGKTAYSAVWTINTSMKRTLYESPVFTMENCEWSFSLEIQGRVSKADQDWHLYLNKIRPTDGHHVFIINISMENRNKIIECMNYAKVTVTKPTSERILWRSRNQVLASFPNIVLDGDVTFVITFLSHYRHLTDLQNAVVSRSNQTPSYLDVHPCLDTLKTDFGRLLECGLQTDVELQCGPRTLRAHKAVLISRSEVFAAMLQNNMLEKQRSSIEIVDMTYPTLEHFLKYLYTGTLPELNMDLSAGLYEAGDKYAIETLKVRCAGFLKEHVTEGNACRLLALADAHSDQDFKDFVMSYIVQNDLFVKLKRQFIEEYPNLALDKMYEAYKSSRAAFTRKPLKGR